MSNQKKLRGDKRMGKEIVYTALGDCFTGGWIVNIFNGFADRFYHYLRCKYGIVKYINLGYPGMTSSGLCKQLVKDAHTKKAVSNSDIITITIGGNNLLRCKRKDNSINQSLADESIARFKEDWPKIIHEVRTGLCSEAQIYVMNLYNPWHCFDRDYDIANYSINQINKSIADPILMQTYGYFIADVYSCFEKNTDKDWTFFYNSILRDPHPNWEGHRQVYYTFRNAFKEINPEGCLTPRD